MINELIQNIDDKTKVVQKEHYVVGSINNEMMNGDMRGWLCGHFYPKDSVFHRNDIEICFKILPITQEEELHHHLCSFEFLLILEGKVAYEIDGDFHILSPGMFYMLEPGNTERIVKVYEKTTIIAVRLPSIPNNKIFEQKVE